MGRGGMKLLFLRGQIPTDRDYHEIIFDTLQECDDMWTLLSYSLLDDADYGEIWYWGKEREKRWKPNFIERWYPTFDKIKTNFNPDIIFCRGGFQPYHQILERYPNSYKIYYGSGQRFLPPKEFTNYNLILQDSTKQLETCKQSFPKIRSELFIKPAADNLFSIIPNIKKEYDICFPANGSQERIKGHNFVFSTFPKDLKILNLGNEPKINKIPDEIDRKRVLRSSIGKEYQKCKVGIVCCGGEVDSCPRVIPEMLSCNLPLIVLDETRFWKEKYINNQTGIISNKDNFWNNVKYVLNNLDQFKPREYYENNLSLNHAAKYIKNLINAS